MFEQKKYFGMTTMQIGIFAGLARLAFSLFCITDFLILGNSRRSANPQAPIATATMPHTAVMITTPTPTSAPLSTPLPYAALIHPIRTQDRLSLYDNSIA